MSTRTKKYEQIVKNLSNKEYRDLYVENHISNGLSFQIRAMRKSRNWSQEKLASEIGTQQEAVSRLENPDYGKFSIDSLKKIASAFDVALQVSFVSFSELVAKTTLLSRSAIDVPSFEHDEMLNNHIDNIGVQYIFTESTDIEKTIIKSSIDVSSATTYQYSIN